MTLVGQYIRVESGRELRVLWTGHGKFEIHIPRGDYKGTLGGLCGDNDGDKDNDLATIDGKRAEEKAGKLVWLSGLI